jgi:hypothetical protein
MVPARAVLVALAGVWWTSAAAGAPAADSFEELARDAAVVSDLGMLLSPFVDDCARRKGELERARCTTVRGYLRTRLPAETFSFTRDGADAVVASSYDLRARAVRLTVAGCLACKQLVEAAAGERRYLTLRAPSRGPSGGPVAVELARGSVPLATPADAETWARTVQPYLRVEVLFKPADEPWTVGASRGYAFAPVGVRVFNRCTGDVLLSQPPSRDRAPQETQCTAAPVAEGASAADEAPESLSPAAINETMNGARPELEACLERHRTPASPRLAFEVAGNGEPVSVRAEGSAAGTALGDCLAGAAMKVKFPPFRGESQRFAYPVLRR